MIAIIALVVAVIALIGLLFHAALADRPDGIAHAPNSINRWFQRMAPGIFGREPITPLAVTTTGLTANPLVT